MVGVTGEGIETDDSTWHLLKGPSERRCHSPLVLLGVPACCALSFLFCVFGGGARSRYDHSTHLEVMRLICSWSCQEHYLNWQVVTRLCWIVTWNSWCCWLSTLTLCLYPGFLEEEWRDLEVVSCIPSLDLRADHSTAGLQIQFFSKSTVNKHNFASLDSLVHQPWQKIYMSNNMHVQHIYTSAKNLWKFAKFWDSECFQCSLTTAAHNAQIHCE